MDCATYEINGQRLKMISQYMKSITHRLLKKKETSCACAK